MIAQESERHARGGALAPPPTFADDQTESLSESLLPSPDLPLEAYVVAAGHAEREWMELQEEEVEYGVADWKGGWHFIRLMKRRPELQKLSAVQALKKTRAAVVAASRRSPTYRTNSADAFNEVIGGFLACTVDEFDAIFVHNWKAIRFLPGESPIDAARRLADRYPLTTNESQDGSLPQYRRLLSLAGWLQYIRPEQNIMLPTRVFGPLLGCSARHTSSYIGLAIDDGFIERVKTYPRNTGRADEYRFAVDRFPILANGPA